MYRIGAAGMLLTAIVLLGGCASSAPKPEEAAAAPVEAAPKPQPKVLDRPAPTAQEIETPLKSGEGEALPVIAQGAAPVGEGGTPRTPAVVPPSRPGGAPGIEEVIDIPTKDLHGGAFPGVGATPKSTNGARANDAVAQRIAEIEKQLSQLRASAASPAPDAAIAAVQARLDELNSKVAQVESGQQDLAARPAPRDTGVDAARVEAIEKQLEALRGAMETSGDAGASAKKRAAAEKATDERITALNQQVDALAASLKKAEAQPSALKGGVDAGELAGRLQAMQQQLDALQARAAEGKPDSPTSALLDELSAKVAKLESSQATPPQPVATGVAPERVEALERQLADLHAAVAAQEDPSKSAKEREKLYKQFTARMNDLEKQIAGIDTSVAKAAEAPAQGGMPSDELAERVQAMQEQMDSFQARTGAAVAEKGAANEALQARVDELSAKLDAIQREQSARPAATAGEAPEARFDKIEQQIAGIQTAMQAPSATAPAQDALDQRFAALESQLDGLRGELKKQSERPVSGAARVDGHVSDAVSQGLGEYRLGAGDKLEFQSFNDEKISRELVTVRFDGNISLPLIPDVGVANLTRAEAEERIREEYRSIFRDPQIALIVREAASKSFTIVGDVEKPGIYPFTQSTKLIEAVSLAGGLRRRSSSSSVGGFVGVTGQLTKAFVVRTINGEREVIQYDMRSLGTRGAHDSEAPIYFGDLIYVPEGVNLVYLLGESRNPVIVELTEGMKLLQLLALSGGFNASTAKLNGVVLMRQTDDDTTRILKLNVKEILRTGKDIALVPGDIVYIPRKRLIVLQEFVQRFTGVISPVLDLYTSAVDAYYSKDLQQSLIEDGAGNSTLDALNNLEDFGQSTSNIVDLFRRPR